MTTVQETAWIDLPGNRERVAEYRKEWSVIPGIDDSTVAAWMEREEKVAAGSKLACPNCYSTGALATVETLAAAAYTRAIVRLADGTLDIEYAGESKVDWDSQTWDGKEVDCHECGTYGMSIESLLAVAGDCVFCKLQLVRIDGKLLAARPDTRGCGDSEREDGAHELPAKD